MASQRQVRLQVEVMLRDILEVAKSSYVPDLDCTIFRCAQQRLLTLSQRQELESTNTVKVRPEGALAMIKGTLS